MSYPALIDRRMPYHRDGTRCGYGVQGSGYSGGVAGFLTGGQAIIHNGYVATAQGDGWSQANRNSDRAAWLFFPEIREVTGLVIGYTGDQYTGSPSFTSLQGSNDTSNGIDGTWETATVASPFYFISAIDGWRTGIKTVSFTGGKRTIRWLTGWTSGTGNTWYQVLVHVYGEKTAGQSPDDIIYIDHDTTPGVEFATPEDFGDRPLATTATRQFRVKNVSATKTANTVNLQCNHADFAISTDGTTWVATINITSLAAGAQSATMYIRNTTPAVGAPLGPLFAEIVATVASWT